MQVSLCLLQGINYDIAPIVKRCNMFEKQRTKTGISRGRKNCRALIISSMGNVFKSLIQLVFVSPTTLDFFRQSIILTEFGQNQI